MHAVKITKQTSAGEIIEALSQNARAVSTETIGEHSHAFCVGRYEAFIARLCIDLPSARRAVEEFINHQRQAAS